jgi:hypothetical protein
MASEGRLQELRSQECWTYTWAPEVGGSVERALDGIGKKGKVLVIGTLAEMSWSARIPADFSAITQAELCYTDFDEEPKVSKRRGASRVGAAPFGPEGGARSEGSMGGKQELGETEVSWPLCSTCTATQIRSLTEGSEHRWGDTFTAQPRPRPLPNGCGGGEKEGLR